MDSARAVSFGVIGLGQCGSNVAGEFASLGYKAVAVNTSQTDLRSLSGLDDEHKLFIGRAGLDGTGRNRKMGIEAVTDSSDALLDLCTKQLAGADAYLVVAGLGGGTGGAAAELVRLLGEMNRPVSVLAFLPWKSESHLVKACALRSLNDLLDTDFASILLIDGQKLFEQHASASVVEFLSAGNAQVAGLIDEFNKLSLSSDLKSIHSFDPEGFRQVFFSGGVTVLGEVALSSSLGKEDLLAATKGAVTDNEIFAGPSAVEESLSVAAVVVADSSELANTSLGELDGFWAATKDLTDGATLYIGIYEREGDAATLYVMAGGLPLPGRLAELLSEATEEAARFATKKDAKKRLKKLDLSALGGKSADEEATPSKGMAKHPGPEAGAVEESKDEDLDFEEPEVEEVEEVEESEEILDLDSDWDGDD